MKKLTENEFEEILSKIKDTRCLDFSKINEFNDFSEEDQERIIYEWNLYGSNDYKIDLANKIIKENDNEPYTEARIAKKLNITVSLAKIIKDYVIAIEDGEIDVIKHLNKYGEKAEYLSNFHKKRFIGIFFFTGDDLTMHQEELIIDETKEFIDVEMGHFELFNKFNTSKKLEYSMFPGGRILYNVKKHLFYLYADKTILKDKA